MDSDDFFSRNKLRVINDVYQKNKDYNCVFNLPKTNKNFFNLKKKNNNKSIWPTILPTSCVTLRRPSFLRFIKYIRKSDFPNLEIDARINIFSNFFLNEYNLVNKKLTFYFVLFYYKNKFLNLLSRAS